MPSGFLADELSSRTSVKTSFSDGMASSNNKRPIEDEEEDSSSPEEDEDLGSEQSDEEMGEDEELGENDREIQVDFEGQSPIEEDFHGIKSLLHQLFLKAHIDLSGLTELIIKQNYIGSILRVLPLVFQLKSLKTISLCKIPIL